MQDADRERFLSAMNALAASFRQDPTEPLLEGYWWGLEALPIEHVEAAVRKAIATLKFMPMVVELRELSGEVPAAVAAIHAFQIARKAIREVGAYQSPKFLDPAIAATIRSLGGANGWVTFCQTDTEDLDKWTRKDFEKRYAGLKQNGFSPEQGAYLPGVHEMQNRFGGMKVAPPVLVGTEAELKAAKQLPPAPPEPPKLLS